MALISPENTSFSRVAEYLMVATPVQVGESRVNVSIPVVASSCVVISFVSFDSNENEPGVIPMLSRKEIVACPAPCGPE